MKAVLLRTASVPVLSRLQSGSPRLSGAASPKISLSFDVNNSRVKGIRRTLSDTDVSARLSKHNAGSGSRQFSFRIPEEDDNGSSIPETKREDFLDSIGTWPENAIPMEYYGEQSKIGDYYRELLKSNPRDSLLLRNYGKFLQEVEKDSVKAEEYYGRAILEDPEDGELLSLYGNLIWTTQRDEERAKSYFHQAVDASPNDCMVLGSYAMFMWEVEDEEAQDNQEVAVPPAMNLVTAC